MGVRIAGQEGQVASAAFRGNLQRVVVRIARVLQPRRRSEGHNRTTRGVGIALADGVVVDQTGKGTVKILSTLRVDSTLAARATACKRLAESRITIEYVYTTLNVVPLGSNVCHSQDRRLVELPLNGDVVVLGHLRLVFVVVTGHVKRHERSELEVRKWSVTRGEGKGEVLAL